MGSRLSVGEKGTVSLICIQLYSALYTRLSIQDILPPPSSGVQGLFGYFLGNPHQGNADRVISVRHSVYTVAWLALNQSVSHSKSKISLSS